MLDRGFNYVYTRRDLTVIIDTTAWRRGVKYRQTLYTRSNVAMVYQLLQEVSLVISTTLYGQKFGLVQQAFLLYHI